MNPCNNNRYYLEDGKTYEELVFLGITPQKHCKGETHSYTVIPEDPEYDVANCKWKWMGQEYLGQTIHIVYPQFPLDPEYTLLDFYMPHLNNPHCGLGGTLFIRSLECNPYCNSACLIETVDIPATRFESLSDINGLIYPFPLFTYTGCNLNTGENVKFKQAIQKLIENAVGCELPSTFSVNLSNTFMQPNCLKLKITNSPIKFKSIRGAGQDYFFDISNC